MSSNDNQQNLLAIDDVMVAKAMQLIMTSFDRPLQVSDIVASVGVSRRSLERRFVTAIGRTLAEEIRRLRMEHARRLLLESDLTVSQIAPRCGYDYAEHFIAAFHRMMGEPPQRFRERMMRGWRGGRPASMNSF
ncbi:MAG: helix-turn-helix transcriptional regulator [Phycisphaerales bacterium]|nr:helix-turn-helix transcriptional regulator [Phycisphaerales bacterium]